MERLFLGTLALLALAGCNEAKQAPGYEAKRDSLIAQKRNPKVERMHDYNYTDKIEALPLADSYTITRRAVDSLGMVRDEDGTRYVDNAVRLTLANGSGTAFARIFTKADFAPMGDARFFRRAVLEGMAFDRVCAEGVRFVASMGLPFSDEYMQFAVTISQGGSMSIEPAEIIDDTLIDSI